VSELIRSTAPRIELDSATTAWQVEQTDTLRRRAALVFLLLAGLLAVLVLLDAFVLHAGAVVTSNISSWYWPLEWFVPALLAVAGFAVLRWPDTTARIEAFVCTVLVIGVLVSAYSDAAFLAGSAPTRTNGLVLFVAAVLPWRVRYQAIAAATAAIAYPLFVMVTRSQIPEVAASWMQVPEASRDRAVQGAIAAALVAGASVVVTRVLYNVRSELRKAQKLGNYIIERELGKGGMGEVYVAHHALIRRPTAVKVMKSDPTRSAEMLGRFEREVQLSANLTHPNTITVYDFGRAADSDTFYYAMEYLEGLDLQRLVDRDGPMPPDRTCYILRQACGSLGEAHRAGILHRDIKPSNIFLTERGGLYDFVKVLDFGLAKDLGPVDQELTRAGQVFGTPLYIAPELARGKSSVEGSADIYSLGCVAFFMLTGSTPFEGGSPYDVVAKHLNVEAEAPSSKASQEIPPELDAAILRCLAKKPEDRFPDMESFSDALAALPFDPPWSSDRAREWWFEHPPATGTPKPPHSPTPPKSSNPAASDAS
jgi:serine/threonine-protein kinase